MWPNLPNARAGGLPSGSNPPPPHPSKSAEENFFGAFGANVLCVPQGHVQGVNQLFTFNSMSLWKWTVMN